MYLYTIPICVYAILPLTSSPSDPITFRIQKQGAQVCQSEGRRVVLTNNSRAPFLLTSQGLFCAHAHLDIHTRTQPMYFPTLRVDSKPYRHVPSAVERDKKYTTEKYKGGNNLDCRYSLHFPGAGYKIIPKIQEPTSYCSI